MLDSTAQDLRYAARKLWGSPGFTLPAVLVLGLGIGAMVAMFSVLHAVVLDPLPFHQPDRLARLYHLSEEWSRVPSSLGHFLTFQEQAESLEVVVAFRDRSAIVAGPAGPEQLRGVWTLGPIFDLFGIPVLLLTRFLDSLLFGITAFDPLALVAVTLLLLLTMTAATWPLVRRASRITPLELLRED